MAAQDEGGDVFHGNVEFFGQEVAEASTIQHAGHADAHVLLQSGRFTQDADHDVERVGDADHEGVRAVFLDAGAN